MALFSMNKVFKALLFLGTLFLLACAHSPAQTYVRHSVKNLSVDNIPLCSGYSCKTRHDIGLSATEWEAVKSLFQSGITSPEIERERVSLAIGLLEAYVSPEQGTVNDRPETPFFIPTNGQLDCIDEAHNTTVFLHLLDQEGLIKWHTVDIPAQRGFFIGGWPHSTAVLTVNETSQSWAIDSWFYVQGTKAEVILLDTWKGGWKPEKPAEAEAEASD